MGCFGIFWCYCISRVCMEPLRCIQRSDDSTEPHCSDSIERSSIQDAQRVRREVLQEIKYFIQSSINSVEFFAGLGALLWCTLVVLLQGAEYGIEGECGRA